VAQVPETVATITGALGRHMSPGQLSETFAELPTDLRAILTGNARPAPAPAVAATAPAPDRMARLEGQVSSLTEAIRALAHGLEDGEMTGVDERRVTRAARLADEILIAAGS
jgi:hypothetical protein